MHQSSRAPTFIPDIADTKTLASSPQKKLTDVVIQPSITKHNQTRMIISSPASYPRATGNIPLIRCSTAPPLFLNKPSSATTVTSTKDFECREPKELTSKIPQEIENHDKNKTVEDMLQALIARIPEVAEMEEAYEYLEAVQKKRRQRRDWDNLLGKDRICICYFPRYFPVSLFLALADPLNWKLCANSY